MTVGNTQRFYVVIPTTPAAGVAERALVWECAWQAGARVLVLADVASSVSAWLPPDDRPVEYGQVGWQQYAWFRWS